MPRIKSEDRRATEEFHKANDAGHLLGDANNCAVIAVAVATGESYDKVHAMMLEEGRKLRRGTRMTITEKVLERLGFLLLSLPRKNFIDRYPAPHRNVLRSITTHHPARFNKVWADGNTYLFSTGGHILCVKNGVNHDWTKGRAKRVRVVYEVVKRTATTQI